MVQIDIKDTNNAIKGSMRLSELVFANEASEALVHEAVVAYLANQRPGNAYDQDSRTGQRRRQKAVQTEVDRACPRGQQPFSALEKRRHDLRTAAARLLHLHAEAGPPYGALQGIGP